MDIFTVIWDTFNDDTQSYTSCFSSYDEAILSIDIKIKKEYPNCEHSAGTESKYCPAMFHMGEDYTILLERNKLVIDKSLH